jgi:hypothetical protein
MPKPNDFSLWAKSVIESMFEDRNLDDGVSVPFVVAYVDTMAYIIIYNDWLMLSKEQKSKVVKAKIIGLQREKKVEKLPAWYRHGLTMYKSTAAPKKVVENPFSDEEFHERAD